MTKAEGDHLETGNHPGTTPPTTVAATPNGATDKPRRVQLSRAKGWKMPPNTVKVDRSTIWGNHDFIVGEDGDAEFCVDMFWHDLDKFSVFHWDEYEAFIAPLRGKNLACWCKLDAPCHADALLHHAATSAPADADQREVTATGVRQASGMPPTLPVDGG